MRSLLLLTVLPFALDPCASSDSGKADALDRPADVVVLTGADLPALDGADPALLAAFRWDGADAWHQVPLQIDERNVVAWPDVYGGVPTPWPEPLTAADTTLAWCDPETFVGADPDAGFDADDELALAASDAGERAPADAALPAGALAMDALELRLKDPVANGVGWIYLFRQNGSLDPAAGVDYVEYQFELGSGLSYLDSYAILNSPNPEVSIAESPGIWRAGFSDRFIFDSLWIMDGAPGAADLLDRHRLASEAPTCARSEDTFCGYGSDFAYGAFLANVDGPVRAIRSVCGANSGVETQRDVIFQARRIETYTRIRVHPLAPFEDVLDLSPAALGMRLFAPWASKGVTLDGDPASPAGDDPTPPNKAPTWEVVTGDEGTFAVSHVLVSDQPNLKVVTEYADDLAPDPLPCTGDEFAIGAFGLRFANELENTDPRLVDEFGVLRTLVHSRAIFVEPTTSPGGLEADDANALGKLRHKQHAKPIQVTTQPFGPAAPPGVIGGPGPKAQAGAPPSRAEDRAWKSARSFERPPAWLVELARRLGRALWLVLAS